MRCPALRPPVVSTDQQCFDVVCRQRRVGIDLVHDDAEMELLKEIEVYQGVLALLHRTKAQMDEQIRLLLITEIFRGPIFKTS